ncbi:hypothetical protein O3G_MSEX006754 [Manduca sexta]|uniref:malate dehydrogenase n=1 Tax=Manduca sexta TaxID=7130 RepID=A0A922CLY9_MANSE|nr:hypothetical protein O3G_MSEX006754 [Manduca sexta]
MWNMLLSRKIFRPFSLAFRKYQVTVVGGASDIGQTLCLLLRAQPCITKLVVHDTRVHTSGVLLDLSHIPSDSKIKGYTDEEALDASLQNSDLVLAVGGEIQNPGTNKKSWLTKNTEFIKTLAKSLSKLSPSPFCGIVTEPINRLVPMAAEIIRHYGEYDPKKLFGVTTIDALRARALFASDHNLHPHDCIVPVIGGHSDKTTVPLLSQSKPSKEQNDQIILDFTTRLRKCDEIVTEAKKGWAPTLSVAFSVLVFTRSILDALGGKPGKVNALIENNDFGTYFLSGTVNVNQKGAGEMERYCDLTQYECYLLEGSLEQLRKDVMNGKKVLEMT